MPGPSSRPAGSTNTPSSGEGATSNSTSRSTGAAGGRSPRKKNHGCWMCHKSFDRPSTLRKVSSRLLPFDAYRTLSLPICPHHPPTWHGFAPCMSVIHRRDCVLFTFMTTDLYCIVHARSLSLLRPFTPHPFPCVLRFIRHFISGVAYTRRAPVTVPPPHNSPDTLLPCFLRSPFPFSSCRATLSCGDRSER